MGERKLVELPNELPVELPANNTNIPSQMKPSSDEISIIVFLLVETVLQIA